MLATSLQQLFPGVSTLFISSFEAESGQIKAVYGLHEGQVLEVANLPVLSLAPEGQGTQSLVIRSRQPLIINSALQEKFRPGTVTRIGSFENGQEAQSALYVPMLAQGSVQGLIQLQSLTPERFTAEDAQVLSLVANTAAAVIQNARLYELAQKELAERRITEQKLRKSEEQYRYLFENNPHPMWAYDLQTLAFLAVNEAAVEKYGYSREEFLKKTISDICPPEELERLWENLARPRPVLQHSGLWRHQLKDGTLIAVEISSHTLELDGHHSALAVALDVTERQQTEAALRQSEMRFATLFKANPAAIAISQPDNGRLVEANDAWLELTGYTRLEIFHQTSHEQNLWVNPKEFKKMIGMVYALGKARLDVQLYQKSGGICEVLMSAELIELMGITYLIVMAQDITERKKAEDLVRRRVNQLEVLYENSLAIGSLLDARQIAEKVIEILGRKLAWHHAVLRSFDPVQKQIQILAFNHTGLPEPERPRHLEKLRRRLVQPGQGISGWVLEHGQSILSQDVRRDARYVVTYPGIRSGLYVPLKAGNVTIGSIAIESTQLNAFNEDDLRLLETLAAQASIALENAQLYLKIQQELLERQQAQENLHQSERHLHAILQATSDGFWIVGPTGRFLDVNEAYCQMLGYTREELLQLEVSAVEALEPGAEIAEHLHRVMEAGTARFETRLRRKDGSVFEVEIGVSRLDDELICFCHDITHRKEAEEELKLANERFTEIANNISDIFWVADPLTGKNLYVSPAFEAMVGLSYASVLGLPGGFEDLVLPEDRQILSVAHQQEHLGLQTDVQYRLQRPDGSIRWLRDKSSPVMDRFGQVTHVVGVTRDVTETMEAEIRLRESEARFRLITETIDEVFWMADPVTSTLLYVSPSSERVWGRSPVGQSAVSLNFLEAIVPEDRESFEHNLALQKTGLPFSHEYHLRHPDGSIHAIWDRGYPVADLTGKVTRYVGVAQDITARKQVEEERQSLIEALSARTVELSLLLEAGHALSETLQTQRIYGILYRYIKAALPCDMLLVSSFDPATALITCEYLQTSAGEQDVSGFPPIPLESPGQGTQSLVIQSGESLLLPDYEQALKTAKTTYYFDEQAQIVPEVPEDEERTRSAIIVPIKVAGKVVGALQIFSLRLQAHTADHLRFVEALAFHISASLSNARLFSELEQRVQERTAEIETIRQRLALATRVAELGIWDWNTTTGELLWDEQMSRNYGLELGAFSGTLEAFMNFVHPEDLASLVGFAQAALGGEATPNQIDYRILRGDGSVGYIQAHGIVLQNEAGEPEHVIGVTRDITQEKLAELALRESEEQNRLLFEEAPDAVVLFDRNARVERMNRAFELLTGISAEEFVGHSLADLGLISNEEFQELNQFIGQASRLKNNLAATEFKLRHRNGSLTDLGARVFELKLQGQPYYLTTLRDITAEKKAREVLRLANAEMERALRLKDEFLATMSHELRTPLNAILGISESLEEQVVGPLNEKQQRYLRTVSESGRHLLALINDILDLSKIEAGRLDLSVRPVLVEGLVQSSLRMVKELAQRKNLEVSFKLDPRVQTLEADERRLKQVLVNLLSNAVKFTPENGKIGLEVVGDFQAAQVTFTVWDTGIGIAPEDLSRLFQPFIQLDSGLNREHAGTGLGLALVSEIVQLHGGRVGVESFPEVGSRFLIVLPWVPKEKLLPKAASADLPSEPLLLSPQVQGRKILLVEDTESVVLFVNDYLQALGYQVIVARDGLAGVAEAKNQVPDLILMDLQMPGMNGLEATRLIREDPALAEIPIIALTAMAMPGDRELCLQAGMQAYLSKPLVLRELAKIVETQLLLRKKGA